MRADGGIEERFAAYVRECGEHHLRVAVLLTGDWHAAEDLVQASLVEITFGDFGLPVSVTVPPASETFTG